MPFPEGGEETGTWEADVGNRKRYLAGREGASQAPAETEIIY